MNIVYLPLFYARPSFFYFFGLMWMCKRCNIVTQGGSGNEPVCLCVCTHWQQCMMLAWWSKACFRFCGEPLAIRCLFAIVQCLKATWEIKSHNLQFIDNVFLFVWHFILSVSPVMCDYVYVEASHRWHFW